MIHIKKIGPKFVINKHLKEKKNIEPRFLSEKYIYKKKHGTKIYY